VLKVLIVYDLPDWILANIAEKYMEHLGHECKITTLQSRSPGFIWELIRSQYKNDIVHFLSPGDFFLNSAYVFKPCVVMIWHMADWSEFKKHYLRIDALTTGSDEWLRRIKDEISWGKKLVRIPYGIDTTLFSPVNNAREKFIEKYNLPSNSLIIGFAASSWSNESGRKGINRVWDALIASNILLPVPVYLRMIGRHWDVDKIPLQARDHVIVEMNLSPDDLPDYYSSLTCYLCASYMEGVPYPVIESMACKAIPITTPVGITTEIISHGVNGFLLQSNFSASYFARLLSDIYKNPDAANLIKDKAREYIELNLEWKNLDLKIILTAYNHGIFSFRKRSMVQKCGFVLTAVLMLVVNVLHGKAVRVLGLLRNKL
jgi:glycosyltransferase involved in cell wall biosynthesis